MQARGDITVARLRRGWTGWASHSCTRWAEMLHDLVGRVSHPLTVVGRRWRETLGRTHLMAPRPNPRWLPPQGRPPHEKCGVTMARSGPKGRIPKPPDSRARGSLRRGPSTPILPPASASGTTKAQGRAAGRRNSDRLPSFQWWSWARSAGALAWPARTRNGLLKLKEK